MLLYGYVRKFAVYPMISWNEIWLNRVIITLVQLQAHGIQVSRAKQKQAPSATKRRGLNISFFTCCHLTLSFLSQKEKLVVSNSRKNIPSMGDPHASLSSILTQTDQQTTNHSALMSNSWRSSSLSSWRFIRSHYVLCLQIQESWMIAWFVIIQWQNESNII